MALQHTFPMLLVAVITLLLVGSSHPFSLSQPVHRLSGSAAGSAVTHHNNRNCGLNGWVQRDADGEWEWEEDDPSYVPPAAASATSAAVVDSFVAATATATPKLPSKTYKPKQSLGQNYLKDPNTVAKIIRAFHADATRGGGFAAGGGGCAEDPATAAVRGIVELGPGAGALTDRLVETYGCDHLQAIEIDDRSVEILAGRQPDLRVRHGDVLQIDYPQLASEAGRPLAVIGNLPYYITSQILFALADASHSGAVASATVTMQWEVAQRMVAKPSTKDYGILSVVFQTYADVNQHFKIPPTVFYPKPKVDSALVGLHFLKPSQVRRRLAGVAPSDLRRVVTATFQQRRKTIRNSLKKLVRSELCGGDADAAQSLLDAPPLPLPEAVQQAQRDGDTFAISQELPGNWASKRPEELTPGQFIELTRRLYGAADDDTTSIETYPLGNKVWRKLKRGRN